MSAATQIYYASFDAVFLKLAPTLRARVEAKIDEIGLRLASFPHHRLKGSNRFRARVGDYRIIDTFDLEQRFSFCSLSAAHFTWLTAETPNAGLKLFATLPPPPEFNQPTCAALSPTLTSRTDFTPTTAVNYLYLPFSTS